MIFNDSLMGVIAGLLYTFFFFSKNVSPRCRVFQTAPNLFLLFSSNQIHKIREIAILVRNHLLLSFMLAVRVWASSKVSIFWGKHNGKAMGNEIGGFVAERGWWRRFFMW